MVDEFWANEVEPNLPAIREKKPGVAMAVLRKSVELGLTAMAIPEEYGGMAMDLPSLMVTAERMGTGRFLRRLALGAHRHRHAANCLLWK